MMQQYSSKQFNIYASPNQMINNLPTYIANENLSTSIKPKL